MECLVEAKHIIKRYIVNVCCHQKEAQEQQAQEEADRKEKERLEKVQREEQARLERKKVHTCLFLSLRRR